MKIAGDQAYLNAATCDNSRWPDDIGRFGAAPLAVKLTPKFQLSTADKFFCIGSCFARNIEEALLYRGVDVLSKRIIATREESRNRPTGVINKFTTASMLNEVRWAIGSGGTGQSYLLAHDDSQVHDLQLAPGVLPSSLDHAVARRLYLERDYFARILQADVIVVTLGLIEAWHDDELDVWLNVAPPFSETRRNPSRYSLHVTEYAQGANELEKMRAIIMSNRPDMKFVITVSPVPLHTTFTGQDVFVANTQSKSVLRAVAAAFSSAHDNVEYFPSYEMVMGSPRAFAYAADCIHVNDSVVQKVVGAFAEAYVPGLPPAPEGFIEMHYLRANPDVEEAVRRGELRSGFDHWREKGQAESRPLRPDNVEELALVGFS